MTVGTGIFLGCVFLGAVFLYVQTRNQWNLKLLGKRIVKAAIGLLVLSLLAGGGYYVHSEWSQRPVIQNSLDGIVLGDKLTDVTFKFGGFEKDTEEDKGKKRYTDEDSYRQKDGDLSVGVRGGRVRWIFRKCREFDATAVNGVSCGDTGDEVVRKFAEKVRIQCPIEEPTAAIRVYDVSTFGVRYVVIKNKVLGHFISLPAELESATGINWGPCP